MIATTVVAYDICVRASDSKLCRGVYAVMLFTPLHIVITMFTFCGFHGLFFLSL